MEAIAEVAIAFVADKFGHPRALLVTAFLLFCLGVNLMMLFRDPDTPLYRVIGPQFLIGAAVASFNLLTSFVVASQPKKDQPALLALLFMSERMGKAVGKALSAAIWNHTLPQQLQLELPEEIRSEWKEIFNSLPKQLSYPVGSQTRSAIQSGYAEVQIRMLVAGFLAILPGLPCLLLMGNGLGVTPDRNSMELNNEFESSNPIGGS